MERKVLAVRMRREGPDTRPPKSKMDMAISLDGLGRHGEAEELFREALAAGQRTPGTDSPQTAKLLHNLACNLKFQNRPGEALIFSQKAVEAARNALSAEHPHRKSYKRSSTRNSARQKFLASLRHTSRERTTLHSIHAERRSSLPRRYPAPWWPRMPNGNGCTRWTGRIRKSVLGFHKSFPQPPFDDSKWSTGKDSDEPTGGFGYGSSSPV